MRRALQRRILRFSLSVASIVALLVSVILIGVSALRATQELKETNERTLSRINCHGGEPRASSQQRICDISEIETAAAVDFADYVLTRDTRTLLLSSSKYSSFPLNAVELTPLRHFRVPTTIVAVSGATWRLYSERLTLSGSPVEVLVGYLEDANWLVEPTPANPRVDRLLKEEAKRIASRVTLGEKGAELRVSSKLDGWAVLDASSGRVIRWDGDLPVNIPVERYEDAQRHFYWQGGRLYLVRSDAGRELLAISLESIVQVMSFVSTILSTFLFVIATVYLVAVRRFRRYFILLGREKINLATALREGENSRIEFKQDAREREPILRAITAFANSNDGTIFVGVNDEGEVHGLSLLRQEQDRFVTGIQNAVRDRIRPNPTIDIQFEEFDGRLVAKIFVPRGEQPLYCFDGRPYLRRGPQSVTADGDEVVRTVLQFA